MSETMFERIIAENESLREALNGEVRKNRALTARIAQMQGLLDDKSCIVRHESDYRDGVFAENGEPVSGSCGG